MTEQNRRSVTALRDLEAAATPAPWVCDSDGLVRAQGEFIAQAYANRHAALIVSTRNALPALLNAVDALERLVEHIDMNGGCHEGCPEHNMASDALKGLTEA